VILLGQPAFPRNWTPKNGPIWWKPISTLAPEMGGHVAKKLGDGLMALFGYPV